MTAASGDPGETPPNGGVDPAFPAYGTPPDPAYGPPAYGAPIGEPAPGYPGSYPPPAPPPGYAPPPAAPYGAPYPGGNTYPGYPGYPAYPAPPQTGTNTMAIIALVSSVLGLLCGVGSLLGIGLGVVSINQIKKTGQQGHGLAVSAIVVGVASLVLSIIMWNYARHMN